MALVSALGFLKAVSAAPAQESTPVENPFNGTIPYTQTSPVQDVNSVESIERPTQGLFEGWAPYVETTFATNYVFGSGAIIGRENPKKHSGVNQTLFGLGKDNLIIEGDNVFISGWTNFDFDDAKHGNGFNEFDVAGEYKLPVAKDISATLGVGFWNYPNGDLGEHGDQTLQAKLTYAGPAKVEGGLIHLLKHEDVKAGDFYSVKFSKDFPIYESETLSVSAEPSFSLGFTDNFYGSNGYVTSTLGVTLNVNGKEGKPFCRIFVYSQDGHEGEDDFTWGGITFPIPLSEEN